ncbi:MAG: CoA pyrophosphatase [Chromatiales bacterium]|jgi:8-oxo-dGTP pyrophosphatase MutT (NUDIX family)|nr:CoA pyrophosphatase [Chromatiales bacterium]
MILAPSNVRTALLQRATALDVRQPKEERRASVAIVLSGHDNDAAICFIERVERPGDRWSGDVAFPGGWANDDDDSLRHTAIRETQEEVGLDLRQAEHLGDLPLTPINTGSRLGDIGSSVFYLRESQPTLQPDPRECADAFWVPCRHLLDRDNGTSLDWEGSDFPGIEYDRRVIWGLTYRMLHDFFAILRREFKPS